MDLDLYRKRLVAAGMSGVGTLETGGGTSWPDYYEQDVSALLAEIERLRTGLGFVSQLLNGSGRISSIIAQATLDGANLLDEDVAIDVCEGHWRKPH